MRIFCFFFLYILLCNNGDAQSFHPVTDQSPVDKYLPVNPLVKKLGIRSITDSSAFISPAGLHVKYYDTAGRLIAELNRLTDSIPTPYVYLYRGDTVFRLRYIKYDTVLASYQRFVINAKGQLLSFLDCGNYYLKNNSFYVGYEEFHYDDKDRLTSWISYTKGEFQGKLSASTPIPVTALEMNDLVYYSYLPIKKGKHYIIGKHALGSPDTRKTDSICLDRENRIIRTSSFSPRGNMGELVYDQLTNIATRSYNERTVIASFYSTYCRAMSAKNGCLDMVELDKEQEEIIYNPDGSLQIVYGFYPSGEKYVVDKYHYRYY